MKYCENCRLVFEDIPRCLNCGNRKLREAQNDDYCYLTEVDWTEEQNTKDFFSYNNIPCVTLPVSTGLNTYLGLHTQKYLVFAPYEYYTTAKAMVDKINREQLEILLDDIKPYLDQLFIATPRVEKKINKLLKVAEDELIPTVINLILNCDKIEYGSIISDCPQKGRFIFITSSKYTITINSATYEIISVYNS